MSKPKNWINVDVWMAEQTLGSAAAVCGQHSVEASGSGGNQRIDCPFACEGDHASKREIAIDMENPARQWKCHAYGCECRGNLLNLMYGWLNGKPWTGDKLRGAEFNQIKELIAGKQPAGAPPPPRSDARPAETKTEPKVNLPLTADEKTRVLMEPPLWEKLVTDVADMPPAASAYVRRHPSLSSEAMKKWNVGVMPEDGGGDKRGWSLRKNLVYTFRSQIGEVLTFTQRDVEYEKKLQAFEMIAPEKRDAKKRPAKHRFFKGFHRGLELFGQQKERLDEPGYREAIAQFGLIVVEGFNDVIRLDSAGIPAVAICSNRITDAQIEKLARWAKMLQADVSLMFDCDEEGDAGAADAAWKLLQAGLPVRAVWGRRMHGGRFIGGQPESLKADELSSVVAAATTAPDDQ